MLVVKCGGRLGGVGMEVRVRRGIVLCTARWGPGVTGAVGAV